MRAWPVFLLALLFLLGAAQAQVGWVQLDDPPPELEGDGPAPADMVDLYYATNATHLFFREDLAAMPEVDNYTYVVLLDKPVGGSYSKDYRLVYAQSGSYLEQWNGTAWVYVEDIVVTLDSTNNSVIFEVPVDSIGGVGDSEVKLWFENYEGADSFANRADRSPNASSYLVTRRSIPNIPLIILPAFVVSVTAVILVLHRRMLRRRQS
jgi:hypothetical protein